MRTALEQDRVLIGCGPQAADARADEHADLIAVNVVQVQPGVVQGLPGGIHAELREPVGPPDLSWGRKGRGGVEVLDFGGDLGVEPGGIERRDSCDAALPRQEAFPESGDIVAQR